MKNLNRLMKTMRGLFTLLIGMISFAGFSFTNADLVHDSISDDTVISLDLVNHNVDTLVDISVVDDVYNFNVESFVFQAHLIVADFSFYEKNPQPLLDVGRNKDHDLELFLNVKRYIFQRKTSSIQLSVFSKLARDALSF